MTLLAPAAFAFAALLSVPVIIHLFRPRRVRQTPFSSLRWLEHSPQKLSRRIRPHQLLLFAMRAGFILLLVFALTRPLFSSADTTIVGERVIVVDVSRSMALRIPGRPTPIERAREIATQLIESAPPGTRTTVLLTANTTRRLGPSDRDASVLLPELRQVEATASDTNLASALPLAKPHLARSGRPSELVFITDNQQGAWDTAAMAAFASEAPTGLKLRVIDVGCGAASNSWIASARLVEVGESPSRTLLRIELAASGGVQDRVLRVTGIPGEPEAVRNVALTPGQPTILHLEVPSDTDLRGKEARIALDPDALPDDDEFFVCLDARAALRVLVIEADSTGPEATRPGFPLRKAMKALTDTGTRAVRVTRRDPTTVSATDLGANDVVVLADVPELPESVATALFERVRQGVGLATFLGPRVEADWYNANLTRPLQPAEGVLPVTLGARVNAPERAAWVLPARPHALLAGLNDPLVGDLAEVSSERYHRLDGSLPNATVIARVPDGTPVLVEHHLGAGTVLLVNASPDESFSDLPRRRSFIPFTDRVLAALGKGRGRVFTAGEPVAVPLEGAKAGESVTLVEPSGARRTVNLRGEGSRGVLGLDALGRPGVYRAEYSGGSIAFAVNAGRGDSHLSPVEPAQLKAWWQPLDCTIELATELSAQKSARGPVALWPWLLIAAALLLAVETVAASLFCPRLSPPVTTSLIQKQRLDTAATRDT